MVWGFVRGLGQGIVSCFRMDRWWLFLLYSLMIWALYWVMSISVLQSLQGMAETAALEGGLAGAADELAEAMAGLSSLGLMDALFLMLVGSLSSLVPVPCRYRFRDSFARVPDIDNDSMRDCILYRRDGQVA